MGKVCTACGFTPMPTDEDELVPPPIEEQSCPNCGEVGTMEEVEDTNASEEEAE
jgi:hypothetical protein